MVMYLFHSLVLLSALALNTLAIKNTFLDTYCNLECGVKNTVCMNSPCRISRRYCRDGFYTLPVKSTKEKVLILKLHNDVRSRVAHGSLNVSASNINALSYLEELAFSAQCWCHSCLEEQDECRSTPNFPVVSQNIYTDDAIDKNYTALWHDALVAWTKMEHRLDKHILDYYDEKNTKTEIRNFVNIIHGPTLFVGCGKIYTGFMYHLICNYAPGLACGSRIFRIGEKCSTEHAENNSEGVVIEGLCETSKIYKPYEMNWREPFVLGKGVVANPSNIFGLIVTFICIILL